MKYYRSNMWVIILILGVLTMGLSGCAMMQPKPTAQLEVIPAETFLSPKLIKKPIMFSGSGYAPNEMVIVDLMIPEGLKIKSVPEDENAVGLAFGTADENGNFSAKMGVMATLNWFFQVDYSPKGPDFKKATPLPPGEYQIIATGGISDKFGMATLTLVPPPKKKE
jgi:hypothetical protein